MSDEPTISVKVPDDSVASGINESGQTTNPLAAETLVSRVHATFSKGRKWHTVPIEIVREVVAGLDLATVERSHATPQLRVHRLRFQGKKTLNDGTQSPIDYNQQFRPGVNVLLVQDNSVGKSTVFKTIEFALTGDDSDYDSDVRSWIAVVWLHFAIGGAPHTIHLQRFGYGLTGYIAAGHVDVDFVDLESTDVVTIVRMSGADVVRKELHQFFIDRFGLDQLGWTDSSKGTAEERRITWRTFFQALTIPDSSEHYLLVSEKNAIGNQEGLLLSVLLGLHLAQPINDLLIDTQKARSATKVSDEQRQRAEAEVAELGEQRRRLEANLRAITQAQEARRGTLLANPDARRLQELNFRQGVLHADLRSLQRRRDDMTTQAQRERARARSLRETAVLQLHFTGLEVAVCPNCDTDVDDQAVQRERRQHHCRLCGKEAHAASPDDVAVLTAEAAELEARADATAAIRDNLSTQFRLLEEEIAGLDTETQSAQAVLRQGPDYALPTAQEQTLRDELLQNMGALRARISIASATAAQSKAGGSVAELRAEVQKRVRKALQERAKQLNASVLARLNGLTQEMVTRIGAESVSDVTCSPVGAVSLEKNGVRVRFSRVNNPGERLRIKLAFFLAMMRLGRVKGAGRHPGFLMIDQPGSDEIVDADFEALADVLRESDQRFANEVQIICFTARPQFARATASEKVYGAQADKFVF